MQRGLKEKKKFFVDDLWSGEGQIRRNTLENAGMSDYSDTSDELFHFLQMNPMASFQNLQHVAKKENNLVNEVLSTNNAKLTLK